MRWVKLLVLILAIAPVHILQLHGQHSHYCKGAYLEGEIERQPQPPSRQPQPQGLHSLIVVDWWLRLRSVSGAPWLMTIRSEPYEYDCDIVVSEQHGTPMRPC